MKRYRLGSVWLEFRKNPRTGIDVRYKERSAEYGYSDDSHPFWELMYVDRGRVRLRLDGAEHDLAPGDFILIAPEHSHSVLPADAVARFYVTAHFDSNLSGLGDHGCKVIRANEEERRLIAELVKEKESELFGAEALALSYLAQFLLRLMRAGTDRGGGAKTPTYFQSNAERGVAEKAAAFLESHFADALTLDEIAAAAGVSNSRLEHLFKRKMEMPVMAYLQKLRIEHSKVLLLESSSNVSEIALLSGYSSVFHFSRRFKQVVGVSPSQYARMVRSAATGGSSGGRKLGRTG